MKPLSPKIIRIVRKLPGGPALSFALLVGAYTGAVSVMFIGLLTYASAGGAYHSTPVHLSSLVVAAFGSSRIMFLVLYDVRRKYATVDVETEVST